MRFLKIDIPDGDNKLAVEIRLSGEVTFDTFSPNERPVLLTRAQARRLAEVILAATSDGGKESANENAGSY